jgi:hypothetical protein
MTGDLYKERVEGAAEDLGGLDYQPLDPLTWAELEIIRGLAAASGSETPTNLAEVFTLEQEELPLATTNYAVFPLSSTANGRTYRINLRVDKAFGDLVNRVRDMAEIMLQRVTQDQVPRFRARAGALGRIEQRRSRAFGFPHALPYRTPVPTDLLDQIAEESDVVAAAVHFALSQPSPGIEFTVNHYSKGRTRGRSWSFGAATVNLYHSKRALRQRLNGRAMRETSASDERWAAVMAHEMLHNLGWSHPKASYPPHLAIEIYEWCVEQFGADEKEDIVIIR